MPRRARLDFPGALNHVIARGVARQRIFSGVNDYEFFLGNLRALVPQAGVQCLAWALLPNHLHLLVRTGVRPLKWFMHRLLLRYSMFYNRVHHRVGHLFQNRYVSILCQTEAYLLELVRYIHLNPLRIGLASDLARLRDYRWCGHGVVLGLREEKWQAADEVLGLFSSDRGRARRAYAAHVAGGVGMGKCPVFSAGGGVGVEEAMAAVLGRARRPRTSRERILGSGEFVAEVLRRVQQRDRRRMGLRRRMDPRGVIARAAETLRVDVGRVYARDRRRDAVRARFLACKWLVEDMGVTASAVAEMLKITVAAVCHGVMRGRQVESEEQVRIG